MFRGKKLTKNNKMYTGATLFYGKVQLWGASVISRLASSFHVERGKL